MNKKNIILLRSLIIIIGICGIIYGVSHSGVSAVVANAIAVCMSCIGLG